MLTAPSGAVGFLARHHTAALSAVAALTGIATAIAVASAWFLSIVWIDVAALALGAVLAGAIGYWHTRHPVVAILAAVTPLPGLVWAAPLAAGSHFGVIPFIAYGFGFVLATFYVRHVLDRLLSATKSEPPWRAAGVVLGLAIVLALVWFWGTADGAAALQATSDLVATSTSVLLLLPLSLALLQFDEAYVAKANRLRERQGRIYEWFGGAAIPRWGLSFTGIALVVVALGWFGAEPMVQEGWWRDGVTIVLVCGGLGAFAGGWREGLGLVVVTAVACLVALWWQTYDPRAPFGAVAAFEVAMLASFLALSRARWIRMWRQAGDAPGMARRRALENSGGAIFAVLGAAAAALPTLLHGGTSVIVLAILIAGLSGALLFAAVLTGIEALLPRHMSAEEAFGKKPRR